MRTCLYCGSPRLQTVGGEIGNPFDRRRERTVCLDCGRAAGQPPSEAELWPRETDGEAAARREALQKERHAGRGNDG